MSVKFVDAFGKGIKIERIGAEDEIFIDSARERRLQTPSREEQRKRDPHVSVGHFVKKQGSDGRSQIESDGSTSIDPNHVKFVICSPDDEIRTGLGHIETGTYHMKNGTVDNGEFHSDAFAEGGVPLAQMETVTRRGKQPLTIYFNANLVNPGRVEEGTRAYLDDDYKPDGIWIPESLFRFRSKIKDAMTAVGGREPPQVLVPLQYLKETREGSNVFELKHASVKMSDIKYIGLTQKAPDEAVLTSGDSVSGKKIITIYTNGDDIKDVLLKPETEFENRFASGWTKLPAWAVMTKAGVVEALRHWGLPLVDFNTEEGVVRVNPFAVKKSEEAARVPVGDSMKKQTKVWVLGTVGNAQRILSNAKLALHATQTRAQQSQAYRAVKKAAELAGGDEKERQALKGTLTGVLNDHYKQPVRSESGEKLNPFVKYKIDNIL